MGLGTSLGKIGNRKTISPSTLVVGETADDARLTAHGILTPPAVILTEEESTEKNST